MPRPDLQRVPSFFLNYINKVPQDDLMQAIRDLGNDFVALVKAIPASKHEYAYAPGKWTLKEVFQHIIDAERVFAYRGLCIARKETQSLPGFDENIYADNSKANSRKWNDLVEEFILVRKASEYLFASFDNEQLESNGISNNNSMYVLGIGFILAGHCQHHLDIIKERYL